MESVPKATARVLAGLFGFAACAAPQAYTISAKPGAVNYVEGEVSINGQPISVHAARTTFLNANDTLSTTAGKAEVLLTPGIFLRLGDNGRIRMIAPSLTDARVELLQGEAMMEVDELVKDNQVIVLDHGGSVLIQKAGLYRLNADPEPLAATLEGKCEVFFGEKHIELGRGHETVIAADLKAHGLDRKKDDELYAWSNIRAEYDAASSYQAAKSAQSNAMYNAISTGYGYGYGGFPNPGWYWAPGFMNWAWLPGNGGFYSPFGYGFYGPGVVAYAPVIYAPVYGGAGGWVNPSSANNQKTPATTTSTQKLPVPVNANHPPAIGVMASSPAVLEQARTQIARGYASAGTFRTAVGTPAANFAGGRIGGAGVRMGGTAPVAGMGVRSSGAGYSGSGASGHGSFSGAVAHGGSSGGGGGHR